MSINDARRAEIVRLIQEIARVSGTAPGQTKFASETGIKNHVWRGKFWRSWSDALAEAGFEANEWGTATPRETILSAIADLANRLGRFPTVADMQLERMSNLTFPAATTVKRAGGMAEVAAAVRDLAQAESNAALIALCDDYLAKAKAHVSEARTDNPTPVGHVYLIRYGKDHKIGRTSSVVRRSRQVQVELPDATELVHSILTDDPAGIEAYWHRRFAEYRGNGEWFRLPPKAVNAFKKWTKII